MAQLQALPDLGPYEVHAGALTDAHIGLTIGVRRAHNTLTGPLMSTPAKSQVPPFIVLQLGQFSAAVHPADVVLAVPGGYRATITITEDVRSG